MIDILIRLLMSLFFAGLFSGLPAMFCLLLSLKVKKARRTGVWIGKFGRRWTRDSDPDRFEKYVNISTIQAVVMGVVACLIALGILAILMQSPTGPPPAINAQDPSKNKTINQPERASVRFGSDATLKPDASAFRLIKPGYFVGLSEVM